MLSFSQNSWRHEIRNKIWKISTSISISRRLFQSSILSSGIYQTCILLISLWSLKMPTIKDCILICVLRLLRKDKFFTGFFIRYCFSKLPVLREKSAFLLEKCAIFGALHNIGFMLEEKCILSSKYKILGTSSNITGSFPQTHRLKLMKWLHETFKTQARSIWPRNSALVQL